MRSSHPFAAQVDVLLSEALITEEDASRARHGVLENNRVRAASKALKAKDWTTLGNLMNQAHASLRDLYAVSCAELDVACAIAVDLDGCLGARMMGGGFGGCVIALATPPKAAAVAETLRAEYKRRTVDAATRPDGIDATVFVTRPGRGAALQAPDARTPTPAVDVPSLWRTAA